MSPHCTYTMQKHYVNIEYIGLDFCYIAIDEINVVMIIDIVLMPIQPYKF